MKRTLPIYCFNWPSNVGGADRKFVHLLACSLCLVVLLLSGVMLWRQPEGGVLAIKFVGFTNPPGQPRSAVFGVTNLAHRTIGIVTPGYQVRTKGVWSEIVFVEPPPMMIWLNEGQGTHVTVAVPTRGEAWRTPIMWCYRPTVLECYVQKGKNLLDTAIRGSLAGWNYGLSMTGHTNFTADMESTKGEPDGPANESQPFRAETNRTPPAAGSRR